MFSGSGMCQSMVGTHAEQGREMPGPPCQSWARGPSAPRADEARPPPSRHIIYWKLEAAGPCLTTTASPGGQAAVLCLWGEWPLASCGHPANT